MAWVSGSGATLLKTEDGGATWVKQVVADDAVAARLDFRDVDAIDAATFVAKRPRTPLRRVFAALRPRLMHLAAERGHPVEVVAAVGAEGFQTLHIVVVVVHAVHGHCLVGHSAFFFGMPGPVLGLRKSQPSWVSTFQRY